MIAAVHARPPRPPLRDLLLVVLVGIPLYLLVDLPRRWVADLVVELRGRP